MKLTFLLLFMTTTLIVVQLTNASPVQVIQAYNEASKTSGDVADPKASEVQQARQQTVNAAPAVPAQAVDDEEDDDDDDDDEDDLDIPLGAFR